MLNNKKEAKQVSTHYDFFPKNHRGQGLSTNAIILIILGVIILAVLIFGFIAGWDTIAPWIEKDNNVDTISQACQIACATKSSYDYCRRPRQITGIEDDPILGNCTFFSNHTKFKGDISKCGDITC